MNKIFKRIGAILLALTLCFGTTLTAFAAEEVPAVSESIESDDIVPYSSTLEIESKAFSGDGDLYFDLSSGNFGATFSVKVECSSTVGYDVVMVDPNGNTYSLTVTSGSGFQPIANYGYAPAGRYTFYFYHAFGSYNTATCTAKAVG